MSTAIHNEMHGEHRQWRHDIAAWQKELQQALAELPQVEAALREHGKALQTHASAIRLYEQDLAKHEHALAEFERGGSGEELVAMAQGHGRESTKQVQQRTAHEDVKRRHHTLMAKWKALPLAQRQRLGSG